MEDDSKKMSGISKGNGQGPWASLWYAAKYLQLFKPINPTLLKTWDPNYNKKS